MEELKTVEAFKKLGWMEASDKALRDLIKEALVPSQLFHRAPTESWIDLLSRPRGPLKLHVLFLSNETEVHVQRSHDVETMNVGLVKNTYIADDYHLAFVVEHPSFMSIKGVFSKNSLIKKLFARHPQDRRQWKFEGGFEWQSEQRGETQYQHPQTAPMAPHALPTAIQATLDALETIPVLQAEVSNGRLIAMHRHLVPHVDCQALHDQLLALGEKL